MVLLPIDNILTAKIEAVLLTEALVAPNCFIMMDCFQQSLQPDMYSHKLQERFAASEQNIDRI